MSRAKKASAEIIFGRHLYNKKQGVEGPGAGEGGTGGGARAQNRSISRQGRVKGAPSLTLNSFHLALGEGLDRGGGGSPSPSGQTASVVTPVGGTLSHPCRADMP